MKIIRFTIIFVVSIIFRAFLKCDEKLLIFSARGGVGFEGNSKYLFLYSIKNFDFRNVWISKKKSIVFDLKDRGFEAYYYWSWKSLLLSLKAKGVFVTHSITDVMPIWYRNFTLIINLWHGIPLKKVAFLDKNLGLKARVVNYLMSKRINFFVSGSYKLEKIFIDNFKIPSSKILNFGSPVIEYLRFPEKFVIYNKKFITPEGKEIILYAPTFRDYHFINPIFEYEYLNWLDGELLKRNALFYIKLHPSLDKLNMSKYQNIFILDSVQDIYPILFGVDHLISDYSSVFLDYILAFPNRKLTLYIPDFEEYKANRDFNFNFLDMFHNVIQTEKYKILNNTCSPLDESILSDLHIEGTFKLLSQFSKKK
jgi:CDP-glycerol glycerophosphotransferase